MATLGKYCKAYPTERFREFRGWSELPYSGDPDSENQGKVGRPFLFLHDNYVVTDGIFPDENIIYNDVTSEWIDFCKQELMFEIPASEPGSDD
ncbi:MAG: hypothetical protein ABI923_03485 [bacterium]